LFRLIVVRSGFFSDWAFSRDVLLAARRLEWAKSRLELASEADWLASRVFTRLLEARLSLCNILF